MPLKLRTDNNQIISLRQCPPPSLREGPRKLTWDNFTIWIDDGPVVVYYEMSGNWLYLRRGEQWYKYQKDKDVQNVYAGARFEELSRKPIKTAEPGNERARKKGKKKRVINYRIHHDLAERLQAEENPTQALEAALSKYYGKD